MFEWMNDKEGIFFFKSYCSSKHYILLLLQYGTVAWGAGRGKKILALDGLK
jgi:hypothetical protein